MQSILAHLPPHRLITAYQASPRSTWLWTPPRSLPRRKRSSRHLGIWASPLSRHLRRLCGAARLWEERRLRERSTGRLRLGRQAELAPSEEAWQRCSTDATRCPSCAELSEDTATALLVPARRGAPPLLCGYLAARPDHRVTPGPRIPLESTPSSGSRRFASTTVNEKAPVAGPHLGRRMESGSRPGPIGAMLQC
ncbi:hypothetical protein DFH09DRAFT_373107 [Mycena vulgaris]|nr:hypothetical protein DFH09DRAFT_373107 [Mycena vulgaris]